MRWRDSRQSSNVDDRRDKSSVAQSGLGSLNMLVPIVRFLIGSKIGRIILVVGVVAYFFGYNPLALLDGSFGTNSAKTNTAYDNDEKAQFVSAVLAQTEDVWGDIFKAHGASYPQPKLVLFRGAVSSGCGFASSQTGPFYCPADQKVYIDLGFYDELENKYKAAGDFAQAYVLSHEVGHHVQNLLGTLDKINQLKSRTRNEAEQNALQVKVELQADCYGGIWAHYMQKAKRVELGDLDEALNAASAIGDDTLQKKFQGYVVPDSFTHGSAEQRKAWFKKGFESGNLKACNFEL
ncbi:MAG: zinc metallopeptidase [Campylobacter sp.]|nr:zinc metallopeptidase [Campylobacter sp.]